MTSAVYTKLTEHQLALSALKQAICVKRPDEIRLAEIDVDRALGAVVAHSCKDPTELIVKMQYLFSEVKNQAELDEDSKRLLDVVVADVSAALKVGGSDLP